MRTFLDGEITGLMAFGGLCVLIFMWVMIRAHFSRRNPIDLTDLITEEAHGKRRITMSRFSAFGGFMVGTWAFVFCAVGGTLATSWEGIASFMAVAFGYRVSDSWLKNQRDAQAADALPDAAPSEDAPKKKGIMS